MHQRQHPDQFAIDFIHTRFYNRETLLVAMEDDIGKAYDAVMAAKLDKAKKESHSPPAIMKRSAC
ncbi:MAG: hypothetical protein PHR30_14970 [Gallionellaceae bacterium]|nr:hypothetical protein [Gallionellaceae bacterium]